MTEPPNRSGRSVALTVRVADAARLLGIGKTKIYELIGAQEIEIIKLGRATLVIRASLEAFIERQRGAVAAAPGQRKRGRPMKTFRELASGREP
ncbi:helix-turn-helix domain-containing protein [Rhizorhabdus sp.]|uniref:helix-turn-helix domain-containing protein n=1 Tax=Rhizorhabdus sp. TaxID=1968843 RepID=UPI0019A18E39|nr:helix-turn-helix domain-containing protein [Rhizorhabdus sp.]